MITLENVKYLGDKEGDFYDSDYFNTVVLYRKYGKLYLARVCVDFFNDTIYFPKQVADLIYTPVRHNLNRGRLALAH